MFKFLKKKKNLRRVYWVLAILIIPTFIWWGVGVGVGRPEKNLVAKINRVPITKQEYYVALENLTHNYRKILGDKFTDETVKELKLREKALEMLIREELLSQEIKRQRIRVQDDAILARIKKEPVFLDKEGKFDEEKFRRIVQRIPADELRQHEEEVRKSLVLQKLEITVLTALNFKVTAEEIADYRKANKGNKMDGELIRQILLYQKRQEALATWYKNLKTEAKIKVWLPEE